MEIAIPSQLWEYYKLNPADFKISKASSGHINQTYILLSHYPEQSSWVAQRINKQVFTRPEAIAHNIDLAANYLKAHHPDYLFISASPNAKGELLSVIKGDYWRLVPFIPNAIALDVLDKPSQAYEAAKQFAKLSRQLAGMDIGNFQITIPRFHDLVWRREQFELALASSEPHLKLEAGAGIEFAEKFKLIVDQFVSVKDQLPLRIMHHDTKISNVLLDNNSFEGKCVIDLDTLMPGYFISDLGDMMRTYLCAYDENEPDFSKIQLREDYFSATVQGYLSEMAGVLNLTEKSLILFSGKYIIYMQALRFLTDFLQGSTYYPIHYPTHNLDRSLNQFQLLDELCKNEKILEQIVAECLN